MTAPPLRSASSMIAVANVGQDVGVVVERCVTTRTRLSGFTECGQVGGVELGVERRLEAGRF